MDIEKYVRMTEEKEKLFTILKEELVQNNKKFNLTAITDDRGVYIKHFLDSVVGEGFIKEGALVAEVGSGGGFPSLPLKIVREDLKFSLIESTGKKCEYLKNVCRKLEFEGMEVLCARAENVGRNTLYREKYDVAIARAVARLNTLCEYCMPLVKQGGKFIAYKGDCDDEIEEAAKAINVLGGRLERVKKYLLPDDEKRSLVIIEKIAPTPQKYPRGQGREKKCPIK